MKKTLALILVIFLLAVLAGCIQQPETKGKVSAQTIQEILAKAKNINNIEYTVMFSLDGTELPATIQVWQKGNKYKMSSEYMGLKSEIIFDGTNSFNYSQEEDIYYKTETTTDTSAIDFKAIAEQALKDVSMKELGKEEINGLQATIIEFSYSEEGSTPLQTKAWISDEYGIPIKLESTTDAGKISMELKNIKVNSVNDSVFVIPQEKIFDEDIVPAEP
ncbi:MAG: hypothetical protein ABIJ74_03075 [archaeon]